VITLDLAMPEVDGLEATEAIMAHTPTPILIVTEPVGPGERLQPCDALAAGAVDAIERRDADPGWPDRLIAAVRMVARITVLVHPRGRRAWLGESPRRARSTTRVPPLAQPPALVALGASTGGPRALAQILSALPASYPVPIVIVMHTDASYAEGFAAWLGGQVQREIRLARPGPTPAGGIVLAPPGRHLIVQDGELRFSMAPPRHHCRPSIDVLFEAVALAHGPRATACLLTGMGRDGARGLLAIRRAGGLTIAQDEATSVAYGMPREAVACGAATHVLPLADIGPAIRTLGTPR
jgi:two-component system chemotaxis response regulator CheB